MTFEFATANRIIFGWGTVTQLPALSAEQSKRPFLLTGSDKSRIAPLIAGLKNQGLEILDFQINGEPDTDLVTRASEAARQHKADLVIAIGGGSVIDSGKAVAALLTNRGDLFDYLEVVGRGKPLQAPSAPCIAVPTTAGTGSEVTRNAVLRSPQHRVKVSMRSAHMLPDIALIDPELTVGMPPDLTASTGLDALTQVIEPYVSNRSNPLTDALCQKAIKLAGRSLLTACKRGEDHQAREEMSLVSLFGGLALANARLGAVHGFAGPLGGQYNAPHGLICGRLLPEVVETNIKALEQRSPHSETLERYRHIASWLTQKRDAPAKACVVWLHQLVKILGIPSLGKIGVEEKDIDDIVAKAKNSSSMKGNPVELEEKELKTILVNAL